LISFQARGRLNKHQIKSNGNGKEDSTKPVPPVLFKLVKSQYAQMHNEAIIFRFPNNVLRRDEFISLEIGMIE
jgi:hypothetical protein